MLFNNLPLPLPWYPYVTLQDRFRQNVATNAMITQLAPSDGVLPFQLRKRSASTLPITWKIKCAEHRPLQDYIDGYEDTTVVDMSDFILDALEWVTLVDPESTFLYDYIVFKNANNSFDLISPTLADGLPPGLYYMEMDFGAGVTGLVETGGKWCSETFRVPTKTFSWAVPDVGCSYPCLKWWNDSDIVPIHYAGDDEDEPFYNLLYLDTWITASEPQVEVEGKNDGFNEFHPTVQKSVIKYRLSAFVPDYIKIAIYTMLLHKNQYLFTEKALRQGQLKNAEVSHSLSVDGALSTVELLFEQMSLMVTTNCPVVMDPPEPYSIGITPALSTEYCEGTGGVYVHITETFPPGLYGELWASSGGAYGITSASYISRADLLAGWHGTIDPGAVSHFKVKLRTFSFVVGESDPSTPAPSC